MLGGKMKSFLLALTLGVCAAIAMDAAQAAGPGGTMVYARRADSMILDPVLTEANEDIWVLTNLYDTLILSSDDSKIWLC
jgi:peptide/nickel transport system substrate-binding protein